MKTCGHFNILKTHEKQKIHGYDVLAKENSIIYYAIYALRPS